MTSAKAKDLVEDPGRISEMAEAMAAGRASAHERVTRYLERIAAVDSEVQAWRMLDASRALDEAQALDQDACAGRARGPLHGVTVAVKDVIDVEGLPTRCYSRALQDRAPASADAQVIAALRAAGAIVLGKAHTTEYAFFDPSPACNPHDTGHTPGGSSSGSAAAVAAGMVPAALGTQTVASVNRPAAYCGIAAYKPSTGLLSTHGVMPLAPMFDTVGFFGRRVADAATLFEAIRPAHAGTRDPGADGAPVRVVTLRDPVLDRCVPAVRDALAATATKLRDAGHEVQARDASIDFERVCDEQMRCALYEMGRVHRPLLDLPREQVGEKLRAAIEQGARIDAGEYRALRASIAGARERLFAALADVDAVLWPAAPDTAPQGLASTGDPRFISPWTALGGPVVTVPVGFDAAGLPIGMLLTGAPGSDAAFPAIAVRLAEVVEA